MRDLEEIAVTGRTVQSSAVVRMARLTRDSMLYASGAVVGKALGLVMLPVLTRALTKEEFGRFDVLSVLGGALITILLMGVDVAAIRLYFDRPEVRDRAELLASWYLLAAAITIPISLVLLIARTTISVALFDTPDLSAAVGLLGIIVVSGTFLAVALGILRARGSSGRYGLLSSTGLVLNAGMTVTLLSVWRRDATSALMALAISWTVGAVVGFAMARKELRGRPSWTAVKSLLVLGLPMAPAVVIVFTADFFQRAFLLNVAGPQEVANLAVAIRFGSVATLMVIGFQYAWQPRTFATATAADLKHELGNARWILRAVAVGAAAIALVTRPLLDLVAGTAYGAAVPTTGVTLLGAIAMALFMIQSTPLLVARKTAIVATATIAGTLTALMLSLVCAPRLAAFGTASAIAIGQLVSATASWRLTRAPNRVPGIKNAAPVVLAAGAVIVAGTMVSEPYAVPGVIAGWIAMAIALQTDGSLSVAMGSFKRIPLWLRARTGR
jgi:O-antigen/teichoic acid export membrane protein